MDIAQRGQDVHGHDTMLGVGGMVLMLLLIGAALAMSARSTQTPAADDVAPFEWSLGAPPVHPLLP